MRLTIGGEGAGVEEEALQVRRGHRLRQLGEDGGRAGVAQHGEGVRAE